MKTSKKALFIVSVLFCAVISLGSGFGIIAFIAWESDPANLSGGERGGIMFLSVMFFSILMIVTSDMIDTDSVDSWRKKH